MAIVVNGKKVAGVGLPGKDGAPGADGKDGAPGKSAYQAAKEKGYTGTEEEFNTALAGMQSAPFLPLAGGTMAGAITLSGPPTNENHAVNKRYVDEHTGAKVVTGSYVGTGKTGKNNPTEISLPKPFKVLCIYGMQYPDSYYDIYPTDSTSTCLLYTSPSPRDRG